MAKPILWKKLTLLCESSDQGQSLDTSQRRKESHVLCLFNCLAVCNCLMALNLYVNVSLCSLCYPLCGCAVTSDIFPPKKSRIQIKV